MDVWKRILPAIGIALLGILFVLKQALAQPKFLDASGPYLGQAPPGTRAERFAPGIVPRDLHSTPAFSPDGQQVYWKAMEGKGRNRLAYSHLIDGRWTVSRAISLGLIPFDSDDPALSADGQALYFTSWRPVKWYRPLPHKERIWYAEQRSARWPHWKKPRPLSDAVNAMDLHWQFSLAADRTLYFASAGDLYRAPVVEGQHAKPQRLEAPVSSEMRENTPFVAPDESYLVFGSGRRDQGQGMDDLYVSFRRADGSWSDPVNLGPEVNSEAHELCPRVSPDGQYLLFLSGKSGTYDAYWIDAGVIERFRPAGRL